MKISRWDNLEVGDFAIINKGFCKNNLAAINIGIYSQHSIKTIKKFSDFECNDINSIIAEYFCKKIYCH